MVLACHRKGDWGGELFLYVTDNMNVRAWLHKHNRRPRNRTASLLIRLVQRLESESNFTVHPSYIRTYRNQLADWLNREVLELSESSWWQTGGQRLALRSNGGNSSPVWEEGWCFG